MQIAVCFLQCSLCPFGTCTIEVLVLRVPVCSLSLPALTANQAGGLAGVFCLLCNCRCGPRHELREDFYSFGFYSLIFPLKLAVLSNRLLSYLWCSFNVIELTLKLVQLCHGFWQLVPLATMPLLLLSPCFILQRTLHLA